MIEIIAGTRGKGKTKRLLAMANEAMSNAHGTVVYLDKHTKHMFELDRKIRLINVSDFPISSIDGFLGFLCGVISQDHDIEVIFLDSFMTLADISDAQSLETALKALDVISEKFYVKLVVSVSINYDEMTESTRPLVTQAL
ncbi:MAG: twitching motility protein PilT [Lachnospiraceae bacterium]|nr:twitching motility protein PilT [Lachnospiraceae bacterium]